MGLQCLACNQPTTDDQPYYCTRCFIPVSPYEQGEYIGEEIAYCPECEEALGNNRQYCRNCNHQMSFYDPPLPAELSRDMQIREENRSKLAQEVLTDNRMTQQVIEMLGIEDLPREQQGVALTALAREKMNFLSVEYNMTEAHTLVDMGHAITETVGEDWAFQITSMRLGMIYYRKGMALHAIKILTDTYKQAPQETEIQQFRKLELLAHLALAHRFAGNAELADEIAHQAHEEALAMYQLMEEKINTMIKERSSISQYMGLDESGASYPRADYIFTILIILAEEAIARGGKDQLRVQEVALDRMMELDNLIKILGNISPEDDTTYFASHLRDYIRIFNGLLWYGDLLLPNAHTRRRFIIEQYYERIWQWSYLIPTPYWLPLRPARFLDVLLRASTWAEFDADKMMDHLFELSPDEVKPRWHYVFADALSKVGRIDDAIEHLNKIRLDEEQYMTHADDELRSLAQQLYNEIHLESIGLLVGVADTGSDWITHPCSIELEEISDYTDPKSYQQRDTQPPIISFSFDKPPEGPQIGIFTEKLLEKYEIYPSISQIGDRSFDSDIWHSSGSHGRRTDIVVLHTELREQSLTLLFEGQPQEVVDGTLQDSRLLLLRGIHHQYTIEHEDLVDILIDLLVEPDLVENVTKIFTLIQPKYE